MHRAVECGPVPCLVLLGLVVMAVAVPAQQPWVSFNDETSTRLSAAAGLVAADPEEKDYAWGDLDQDGDPDLVVARKQPYTTPGRRANVLLMNEGGVLTDRSASHASASNVAGSQGFLDLTNDRDVFVADLTGDGWLDVVTATTLSGSHPKYISHPRVYVNLGDDGNGNWQGLLFDDENRIPTFPAEPRFCTVQAGDVDNDGDLDLYFGDYQQGGFRPVDVNDRLLINDGSGYFTDETALRMTAQMVESSFCMSSRIHDMNGDGKADIIKDDALQAPHAVSISYNDTATPGFFGTYQEVYFNSPYHVAIGDLNQDGTPDMVICDDGADRFMLNQGNDVNGHAIWGPHILLTFQGGGFDEGFGGNTEIFDLNNDGWPDVLVTDEDVNGQSCSPRHLHIFRNLGNPPNVTLREERQGNLICGIPYAMMQGTHDVAVLDINGDGWKDLVIGRCFTTEVWINDPPVGFTFGDPQPMPQFATPGTPVAVQVTATPLGTLGANTGSGLLHVSVNGGPFAASPLTYLGGDVYEGVLPLDAVSCNDQLDWYFSLQDTSGATFTEPASAPVTYHTTIAADGFGLLLFEDDMEGSVAGWTVVSSPTLTGGAWEQAAPNGTLLGASFAAPNEDADPGATGTMAFVTENAPLGASPSAADVDGGPTELISPVFDLSGGDAVVSYHLWYFTNGTEPMLVQVSNDGGAGWTVAHFLTSAGTGSQWQPFSFRVGDYVTPTANVQVKFWVNDIGASSIVEAGVDRFKVEGLGCTVTCQQDLGFQGPGPLALQICGGDLSQGTTAELEITGALPGDTVILVMTDTLAPQAVLNGTAITTTPLLVTTVVADGAGTWTSPAIPGGLGSYTYYLQAAEFRGDVPGGLAFSNGSELVFLP